MCMDATCRHARRTLRHWEDRSFRLADAGPTVVAAGLRRSGRSGAGLHPVAGFRRRRQGGHRHVGGNGDYDERPRRDGCLRQERRGRTARSSRRAVIIARGSEFVAALLVRALGVSLLFGLGPAPQDGVTRLAATQHNDCGGMASFDARRAILNKSR
jgi:hypothetical protein